MPNHPMRASTDIASRIEAITQRVVCVEYPSAILSAGAGAGCAVIVRSPLGNATHLYRPDGTRIHSVHTTTPISWHMTGFVTNIDGLLERWSLDSLELESLGYWPGRRVNAAAGCDLWLSASHTLWRHDSAGDQQLELRLDRALLGDLSLSPTGGTIAARLIEDGGSASSLRVYSRDGTVLHNWNEPDWCIQAPAFVGEDQLVVTRMRRDSTAREIVLIDLPNAQRTTLVRESSGHGFVRLPPAVATPGHTAYLRYVHGWPLLCAYDLTTGNEIVVNPGQHEDLTDVDDAPSFSPTGRYLAFNSSAADLRERHLYVYDLQEHRLTRLSHTAGATGAKAWVGEQQLVFVESSELEGAALRWLNVNDVPPSASQNVSRASPSRGISPIPLTLEGPEGTVPADLYLPSGLDSAESRPALVYAHGGVFRQLTRGYPASFAYTLLHEINLGLLELGFVVMSVEYRGSMGFGLEHDQANWMACGVADTADCALAAQHLASLPYVDPKRIGIWGLSWGGTMTLQALVRYPDLFAAGVNLAGIWDFEQRARFWNTLQAGQPIYFDGRMGPFGSEERQLASARNLANDLRAPLLSLHGTKDEAVDYEQQSVLQADAARLGKHLQALTFEGESHVFATAEAWREAVPTILHFLLKHLGNSAPAGQ